MMTLPALRAPLPVLVDEVLCLTAKLHPDEALARLGPLWAASTPGIAQRALLAARITLMRRAMTVAPPVAVLPEPDPVCEPEPAPVFVPAPPPKPAPLKTGALTLLNLEDAAKMLMAGGIDDHAEVVEAADLPADVALADARMELAEVIAAEAAMVDAKAKAKKPKAKRAEVAAASPVALDLAAQFAAMGGDDAGAAAKPAKKAKAAGLAIDLSAQFAAMGED